MHLRRLLPAILLAVVSSLSFALVSSAQISSADRAEAIKLAKEGKEALEKKDFSVAADRFARADALVHAPTLKLGLARAQVGLGKWVEALGTYDGILNEGVPPGSPPVFFRAVGDARKERDALSPRIPSVVITVTGAAPTEITIDGAAVPLSALGTKRQVDPGKRVIRATAEDFIPSEANVTLAEGQSTPVMLALMPVPPPAATQPPAPPPPPTATVQAAPAPVKPPLPPKSPSLGGDTVSTSAPTRAHRWQPGAMVRLDVDPLHPGARTVAGLTIGLFDHLEVGASAIIGRDMGMEPQAMVFLLKGAWKPLFNAGVPIFFVDGAYAGIRGAAGLQWDPTRHFGVFAQVGGVYFPSVPAGYQNATFLPSMGFQGRL